MGILKPNTLFGPSPKSIKFYDGSLIVVDGAAMLAKLPLCDVKVTYDQYSRKRVIIPAGASDFELKLCDMGEVSTFIVIKPTYDTSSTEAYNYLSYTVKSDTGSARHIKELAVMSGTSEHPVPTLLISNPDEDYAVVLDILVCTADYTASTTDNDYDVYVIGIDFNDVKTVDFGTSFGVYNTSDELVVTIEASTVQNISISGATVVVDSTASGLVGMQFASEYHAKQALSAISWLIADYASRSLPQAADSTGPVITTDGTNVVSSEATLSLASYSGTIHKSDVISYCIDSVVDDRDDNINPQALGVAMSKSGIDYMAITLEGVYTVVFTSTDLAGNHDTETITLTVTA